MANYVVKLYNQTGFDTCNVPESPRMIEANFTPYKIYDTFELVQGRYLANLRVQLTGPEANKIDLITVSSEIITDTTVYIVDHYEMKAPDVCEFFLLIEPYSTLGGFGYDSGNQVLNGSIKRCHVSVEDDNKNFYTLPEPFENREPIEWTTTRLSTRSSFITLIEVVSIPTKIIAEDSLAKFVTTAKEAAGLILDDRVISRASANTGSFVGYDKDNKNSYVYQYMESTCPRPLKDTKYIVANGYGDVNEIDLGARWFDAENKDYVINVVQLESDGTKMIEKTKQYYGDLLSDMASDGRLSDVTAIWQVPKVYFNNKSKYVVDYNPEGDIGDPEKLEKDLKYYGGFEAIENMKETGSIPLTKWATTTYNNKINYGQDLRIKIYNPASNGTLEHSVTDVMAPGSAAEWISSVPYTITADLRPTGNPVFMFNYLHKSDNVYNMTELLNGGPWRQVAISMSGIANKTEILGMQHRDELNDTDTSMGIVNMVTSLITGLNQTAMTYKGPSADASDWTQEQWYNRATLQQTGLVTGFINNGYNIWRNNKVVQQQNAELNCRAATASVTFGRNASNLATDMNNNGFFAIVSHFSNNDLRAFDTFLTRYGYNVGNMPFDGDQTVFYNRPKYNFVQVNDMTVESVTGNINLVNDTVDRLKQGLRIWHVKPNPQDLLAGGNR